MQPKTRRILWLLVAIAGLQGGGWLIYRFVEARRGQVDVAHFSYAEVSPPELLQNLTVEDIQGNLVELASFSGRPVLLHFWATWCAPCRTELPSLLAYAKQPSASRPALVLVSLDENWQVIRHHFGDAVPPEVVRDVAHALARELRVEILPETLLLRPPGAVVARMPGARSWQTEAARSTLLKLMHAE